MIANTHRIKKHMTSVPLVRHLLHLVLIFAFPLNAPLITAQTNEVSNHSSAPTDTEEETAGSGIFKQIDSDGRIIFTDNPIKETSLKEVELRDLNVHKETRTYLNKPKEEEKKDKPVNYQVWIKSPQNEEQIGPIKKALSVSVGVNRALPHYVRVQLYFDGKAFNNPQISKEFSIPLNLKSRGKRSLQASLIDTHTGKVVARSSLAYVYVIRP